MSEDKMQKKEIIKKLKKEHFWFFIGIIVCCVGIFLHFFLKFPTYPIFGTLLAIGIVGSEDYEYFVKWIALFSIFWSIIAISILIEIIKVLS